MSNGAGLNFLSSQSESLFLSLSWRLLREARVCTDIYEFCRDIALDLWFIFIFDLSFYQTYDSPLTSTAPQTVRAK